MPTSPRWRKALPRKRPRPPAEVAKSASLLVANSSARSGGSSWHRRALQVLGCHGVEGRFDQLAVDSDPGPGTGLQVEIGRIFVDYIMKELDEVEHR